MRLSKKERTYCAFIDFKKAFDRVNRNILWTILAKRGVSLKIISLLRSMYANCSYSIRLDTCTISDSFDSNIGVQQGCQLSPILFLFFIDELVECLLDVPSTYPPAFGDVDIPLLLFADDVVLVSHTPGGLQKMLLRLESFCSEYKMEVNVAKSKTMVFKTGTSAPVFKWRFQGLPLETVTAFSYLGIVFSSHLSRIAEGPPDARKFTYNLSWEDHFAQAVTKASRAKTVLQKFVTRARQAGGIQFYLKLFDTMVSPILQYGGELMAFEQLEKFELVCRSYYRFLLGLPSSSPKAGLDILLNRRRLESKMKLKALKYWFSIINRNENSLIRVVYDHLKKPRNHFKGNWVSEIKNLLDNLGYSEVWLDQESEERVKMNSKPFLKLLKLRLEDNDISSRRAELLSLKCHDLVSTICPSPCLAYPLKIFKSPQLRHQYARLCLQCPGSMLQRSELCRCSACGMIIPKSPNSEIFMHRILRCPSFVKLREKVRLEAWFRKAQHRPSKVVFRYLVKYHPVNALRFFK
jgi:hypothetical protein